MKLKSSVLALIILISGVVVFTNTAKANFDITNHGLIALFTNPGERMVEFFNKYRPSSENKAESAFAEALQPMSWLFEGCYKYEFLASIETGVEEGAKKNNSRVIKALADETDAYFNSVYLIFKDIKTLTEAPNPQAFSLNFEKIEALLQAANARYANGVTLTVLTSTQNPFDKVAAGNIIKAVKNEGIIFSNGLKNASYELCSKKYGVNACAALESDNSYPRPQSVLALEGLSGAYASFFDKWQGEWGVTAKDAKKFSCADYKADVAAIKANINSEALAVASRTVSALPGLGEGMEEAEYKFFSGMGTSFIDDWQGEVALGTFTRSFDKVQQQACKRINTFTTCDCTHL